MKIEKAEIRYERALKVAEDWMASADKAFQSESVVACARAAQASIAIAREIREVAREQV